MFNRRNLRARSSLAIEAVVQQFLETTQWSLPGTDQPPLVFSVTLHTRLWHPNAGVLKLMIGIEALTWEIWSFLDRALTLLLIAVAFVQLHGHQPSTEVSD